MLTAVGLLFLRPFARLMGAEGELLENSLLYGTINLIALPFYILQYEFQCLFATAEKPKLGLYVTVASGVANMVLDWLLVAVLPFGLAGAAAATAASQFIGGVFPLIYFARKNSSRLHLTRCRLELRPLGRICANGSSELMGNISMSLVSMLYNVQLMQYVGEDGIAALWRTDVCQHDLSGHLHRLFRGYRAYRQLPLRCAEPGRTQEPAAESHLYCGDCRAVHVRRGELLAAPLSRLFVAYDEELLQMTTHAFAIFSFSFLFSGFAINGSSFFTALNDGLTSALISFLRTLVFQVAAVLLFPLLWGLDGIWFSIVAAEIMAVLATIFFLLKKQKKYGY